MSRVETRPPLSDETRFELAMAAAGRARRNRPTALIVTAGIALVAALIAAAWGLGARASARTVYVREQTDSAEVERLATEWTRLDQAEREGGDTGKPIPEGLFTRLEMLARRAGMKDTPKPPRPVSSKRGDITLNEYVYQDIRDPELKALMEWMRLATTDVPGLEVYSVRLRPEANNWNLDVTFRRAEKTGS